jgi:hypothetical protein
MASTLPKKERGRPGLADRAVGAALKLAPGLVSSIDLEALQSETDWVDLGAPTYFPESQEMLEMLWKAKMDVRMEDLGLDELPRAFSVAWPDCEIGGQRLKGCLLWWGSVDDRKALIGRFDKKVFGRPWTICAEHGGDAYAGKSMHVYYTDKDEKSPAGESLFRAKVQGDRLDDWLLSKEEFARRGEEGLGSPLVYSLNEDENERLYVVSRLAARLMVYMRACPDKVKAGYPQGRKAREFATRWTQPGPRMVGQPACMSGGHGSPAAHWRTWHFRSYPTRKDGTKRGGVVFIGGTVVGAEVDPETVE